MALDMDRRQGEGPDGLLLLCFIGVVVLLLSNLGYSGSLFLF